MYCKKKLEQVARTYMMHKENVLALLKWSQLRIIIGNKPKRGSIEYHICYYHFFLLVLYPFYLP